jgi:hypothetical protein
MTHDIDDLLELINILEERIIQLECDITVLKLGGRSVAGRTSAPQLHQDNWYWEHG